MTQANRDNSDDRARWWTLALVLSGLCLVYRAPALLAMPIFGDEAIYLRWAQLIRPDGGGHWWVSLCDPKPPLHFWLIAAVLKWARDPLAAARMISVLSGVLSVPAIMLVAAELADLARAERPAVSGRALGLLAAVLMIFCPFLAFYQRLATADALFVLEMLAAAWLALRWARLLIQGQSAWGATVALGVAMGIAMMTRQGLSYTLWGLPLAAAMLQRWKNRGDPALIKSMSVRHAAHCLVPLLIAAAMWTPYLAADLKAQAAEHHGIFPELKRRILYQSEFIHTKDGRWNLAARNFRLAFVPRQVPGAAGARGLPLEGWLFYYLTPAVYAASLLGLVYLAVRRQWRMFLFITAWLALMLGPPIILGGVIFSRYLLAGVPPLLLAVAFLLADTLTWIMSRPMPSVMRWSLTALVLAGLLTWPLREIGTQTRQWNRQFFTGQDHLQYLTGWASGWAARGAIRVLTQEAAIGPVIVITDAGWGNPADAAWVYLSGLRNVTLYYTTASDQAPMILTPAPGGPANTFLLRSDKFLFTPPRPVTIPAGTPVFYITNDPLYTATGAVPAEKFFRAKNPNLGPPLTFYGIGGADAPPGQDRVLVFPVQ